MTSNTRHKSSVALILIDVINHFDFLTGSASCARPCR